MNNNDAKSNFIINYSYDSNSFNTPKGFKDNYLNYTVGFGHEITKSFLTHSELKYTTTSEKISQIIENESSLNIAKKEEINANLDAIAKRIFISLRNYPFEHGYSSFADLELLAVKNDISSAEFYLLLPKIAKLCYQSKSNIEYLHFLNCLLNLTNEVDNDSFCFCGVSAVAHKNIEIKEAGIALFEKMRNPSYADVLDNVGDTGIDWLDKYKQDVVAELREIQ